MNSRVKPSQKSVKLAPFGSASEMVMMVFALVSYPSGLGVPAAGVGYSLSVTMPMRAPFQKTSGTLMRMIWPAFRPKVTV